MPSVTLYSISFRLGHCFIYFRDKIPTIVLRFHLKTYTLYGRLYINEVPKRKLQIQLPIDDPNTFTYLCHKFLKITHCCQRNPSYTDRGPKSRSVQSKYGTNNFDVKLLLRDGFHQKNIKKKKPIEVIRSIFESSLAGTLH